MADLDFDLITEQLFVGGRPGPADWHILAALGITVDINLQAEAQDHFTINVPEVYLWLPTPDWFGPGVHTIRIAAQFIDHMIRDGRKVYVHCNSGVGRAPTAAAGYFVLRGMGAEEAVQRVQRSRPVTNLTQAQMQQLQEYADGRQSTR